MPNFDDLINAWKEATKTTDYHKLKRQLDEIETSNLYTLRVSYLAIGISLIGIVIVIFG